MNLVGELTGPAGYIRDVEETRHAHESFFRFEDVEIRIGRKVFLRLTAAVLHCFENIHAAQAEQHAHRPHLIILFPAFYVLGARRSSDVRIPSGIDNAAGKNRLPPGFVLNNYTADAAALHDGINDPGVGEYLCSGLLQAISREVLERLRVKGKGRTGNVAGATLR